MQVPPEQPIGPGGYPRDPGYGVPEKFVMDMVMGIILILLAALGTCLGGLAVVGGGFLAGAGSTIKGLTDAQGNSISGSTAQAAGGIAMVFGIILLIICIAEIVGGVWMVQSLAKGMRLVFVIGAIGLILNIISGVTAGHFNFFGLGVGLIFPAYAAARLYGNFGPKALN